MQTTYIGHKFTLFSNKIALLAVLTLVSYNAMGQIGGRKKDRAKRRYERRVSYGFVLGGHTSAYQVRYSNQFVTQDFDTLHSVMTPFSSGFSLGFLVNLKLAAFLDLRLMPKAGFYQHKLEYNYISRNTLTQLVETTMVEFPLLLKYKSMRREGIGMYIVGGITPAVEASGKNDQQSNGDVSISRWNLSLDAGIGFDIYLPLFKFSPEIRFSGGLLNLLGVGEGMFNGPLKRINTNTISIYFIFQ